MTLKLKKCSGNPVLRPLPGSDWEGLQARNPAAILHDGKVHLFYTATGDLKHDHIIYLGHAVSEDGYHFSRTSDQPYVEPAPDTYHGFDAGGVEDPRIVKIDDTFYMTYMARAVPPPQLRTGRASSKPGKRRRHLDQKSPAGWPSQVHRSGSLGEVGPHYVGQGIRCERHAVPREDQRQVCHDSQAERRLSRRKQQGGDAYLFLGRSQGVER